MSQALGETLNYEFLLLLLNLPGPVYVTLVWALNSCPWSRKARFCSWLAKRSCLGERSCSNSTLDKLYQGSLWMKFTQLSYKHYLALKWTRSPNDFTMELRNCQRPADQTSLIWSTDSIGNETFFWHRSSEARDGGFSVIIPQSEFFDLVHRLLREFENGTIDQLTFLPRALI